jgi:hypothetical protein
MYTEKDFKSKKALKEALAAGEKIAVYAPGLGEVPENGRVALEGPHYPRPHAWYAEGIMENGFLKSVK